LVGRQALGDGDTAPIGGQTSFRTALAEPQAVIIWARCQPQDNGCAWKFRPPASDLREQPSPAWDICCTVGRATWDHSGKANTPLPPPPCDTVWVEDVIPNGRMAFLAVEISWNWVSSNPTPFSGSLSHQSAIATGIHYHGFNAATTTLAVNTGDTLVTYVYSDPANPPQEIMIGWATSTGDGEHRAYWGQTSFRTAPAEPQAVIIWVPLPATGQWVRLEVSGLQRRNLRETVLNSMGYLLYGGRATWDYSGKRAAAAAIAATM